MTAVLPLSRLDVPAWFLPLAQDESPLKWWPPTPSSERHQKTSKHGVLNDIIAWLEDYPPPQPFIPPPTDEPIETSCQASNTSTETTLAHTTFSETISKSSRINDQLASVTAVDTQILPANEKAHGALDNASMPTIRVPQGSVDVAELMTSLRESLLSSPQEFKQLFNVLVQYEDAARCCILQEDFHSEALLALLDPFSGEHDLTFHLPPSLAGRIEAEWRARVLSILRTTNWTRPEALDRDIWVEAAKLLCQPRRLQTKHALQPSRDEYGDSSISSDGFATWCSTLKNLAFLIMDLRPKHRRHLRAEMRKALIAQASTTGASNSPLTLGLGWAIVLLNNTFKQSQVDFDKNYQEFISNADNQHRDAQTFYLVMSQFHRNACLPYEDYASIVDSHHEESRWAALFSRFVSVRSDAVILLRQAKSLLNRMGYLDEAAASVCARLGQAHPRCDEGLAIAMDDHRAALQLHDSRRILHAEKTKDSPQQVWSYTTWGLYVHAMIKDPRIPIMQITDCIGTLGHRNVTKAPRLDGAERRGRARLLEDMSHTLAYDAPNYRPWRVWKELSVWNQLYHKLMLRDKYSSKISNIMMDLTMSRMKRGEVVKPARINFLVHMVRAQMGEQEAKTFEQRVLGWQKRNKTLGTSEQKFPVRFRPQQSVAELEMVRAQCDMAQGGEDGEHLKQEDMGFMETLESRGTVYSAGEHLPADWTTVPPASHPKRQEDENDDDLVQIISSLRIRRVHVAGPSK